MRYVADSQAAEFRIKTLFVKEPMTIEWMHSFRPDEIMLDVGANIGMYSCYAAKIIGARVYAFEPELT